MDSFSAWGALTTFPCKFGPNKFLSSAPPGYAYAGLNTFAYVRVNFAHKPEYAKVIRPAKSSDTILPRIRPENRHYYRNVRYSFIKYEPSHRC